MKKSFWPICNIWFLKIKINDYLVVNFSMSTIKIFNLLKIYLFNKCICLFLKVSVIKVNIFAF